MEIKLRYCERIKETELLGPYKRSVIWVYGCCFDCEGCIAHNFRYGSYCEEPPAETAQWFLSCGTEHLTVSGGEPFLQAEALAEVITLIKEKKDIGVIIYSGFTHEELLEKSRSEPQVKALLSLCDILIDGRYIKELDDGIPYRGSSNQRIIQLTGRYKDQAEEYYRNTPGRRIEIALNNDKTMMIGVPSRDQAQIWQRIKSLSGDESGREEQQ